MSRHEPRFITARGRTQTMVEWARELGTSRWNIRKRIRAGWSPEEAVTTPVNGRLRHGPKPGLIDLGGRKATVAQIADELGLSVSAVRERVRKGWSVEQILSDNPRAPKQEDFTGRELYHGANLKPWSKDDVAKALVAEFGALSREQVAAILGCSNERVRQIESEALAKLARHGRRWRDAS